MTLGEKIQYLREKIPLYTQSKIAQDLNLSIPTIWRYETNQRIPSLDILVKMANVFKITLDDLVKDTNYATDVNASRYISLHLKINKISDKNIERLHHYIDYLNSENCI